MCVLFVKLYRRDVTQTVFNVLSSFVIRKIFTEIRILTTSVKFNTFRNSFDFENIYTIFILKKMNRLKVCKIKNIIYRLIIIID